MNKRDLIVISAYTGYKLAPFDEIQKAVEEALERPVLTHEFADENIYIQIRKKLNAEFRQIAERLWQEAEE